MYKNLLIPILFLLVALFLDNFFTAKGTEYFTLPDRVGNPVVAWLWTFFGGWSIALPFVWALFLIGIALLLSKKREYLGIWLLYTAVVGHFIAFLSWTFVIRFLLDALLYERPVFFFLLVCTWFTIGFLLTEIHMYVRGKLSKIS